MPLSSWASRRSTKTSAAFIVGAGPSLGKNCELLARAAKKGIVFAVNSSALALGRRGVTPQVVACMESIDLSELLSQVPYLDQVVRAFSLTAHPKTMRTGAGPLLPVYEGLPQFAPLIGLGRANGLAVCGSVSTLAFSLAQRLGCSPIVLVGQDLAYTDGQAYAAGTPYAGSRVKLSADGASLIHPGGARAPTPTVPQSRCARSARGDDNARCTRRSASPPSATGSSWPPTCWLMIAPISG